MSKMSEINIRGTSQPLCQRCIPPLNSLPSSTAQLTLQPIARKVLGGQCPVNNAQEDVLYSPTT